jgi:hypothetical protein
MDADNWLREIEKKLELTELTEEECVTVAAHQLIGTASAWWDSYCDSHLDPLHIGWDEFVEAFRSHHILEAVWTGRLTSSGTSRWEVCQCRSTPTATKS